VLIDEICNFLVLSLIDIDKILLRFGSELNVTYKL